MAELDDIIHQPLRLKIMAALNALPATAAGLEFAKLKKLTGATDGNLGAHIETLAKAGYVSVEKAFVGRKPQTTVTATAAGRGCSRGMWRRCRRLLRGGRARLRRRANARPSLLLILGRREATSPASFSSTGAAPQGAKWPRLLWFRQLVQRHHNSMKIAGRRTRCG